jgi:HEAT repeat protein
VVAGKPLPQWWSEFTSEDANVRRSAEQTAAKISLDAAPALIQGVQRTDKRPVQFAALRLIALSPAEVKSAVFPELLRLLDSNDDGVRLGAVMVLDQFGAIAKPAVPKLLALQKDKNEDVRTAARMALNVIDPQAADQAGGKR